MILKKLRKTYIDVTFTACFVMLKVIGIKTSWWWLIAVFAFDVLRSLYARISWEKNYREEE